MEPDNNPNMNKEDGGYSIKPLVSGELLPATTYANTFDVNWTLTDATIQFTQIVQILNTEGKIEGRYKPLVSVMMPWWQVKMLSDVLSDVVKRYEIANGELTRPKLP